MKINRVGGVLRWTHYFDGERVKRSSVEWKTKKDAQAHFDAFKKEYEENYIFDNDIYFSGVILKYLEHIKTGNLKISTIRKNTYTINNYLLPFFGDTKMRLITIQHIDKFQSTILKKVYGKNKQKLSNKSLEKIQSQLNTVFNFAQARGWCKTNPFALTHYKYHRELEMNEKKEKVLLELDELNELIEHEDDLIMKTLYIFLSWMGCRPGEAFALTVGDYDKDTHITSFTKNWDSKDHILVTTKTDRQRFVHTPKIVQEALNKLLDSYPSEYMDKNSIMFGFTHRLAYTTALTHLKESCENINIEKNVSFMTFRHTNVSLLSSLGFTDKEISVRTGHSVEILNKHYKHLFDSRIKEVNEKLDNLSKIT